MTSDIPPPVKARPRYGRWVLVVLLVMLAPIVAVGIGMLSMLSLDREAASLRREVMAASSNHWDTRVQFNVGPLALGTVRTALRFVRAEHMDEARLALAAVRGACVGVYTSTDQLQPLAQEQLFARTDARMRDRGWSRLVGVVDDHSTVMVYASDEDATENRMKLCLVVVDGRDMVVVSGQLDPQPLIRLVEQHAPEGKLKERLRLAQLSF